MEGITAFTPPPKQFAKAAAPVVAAVEDEETQANRGVWIVAGAVFAVLVVLAVGYWISSRFTDAPPRPAATATRPIVEKPEPVPEPSPPLAEPGTPPVPAASSMQEAASGVTAPAPRAPPARASRAPSAQASKQQPSVFVANPEWKSQVRRIGNVDAETERSTMTVLDAIHQAQERERERPPPTPPQPRSSTAGSER